jgi:hypothetical protein
MKALGKGSVASVVKVGLDIVWVALWIGAIALAAGALLTAALAWFGDRLPLETIATSEEVWMEVGGVEIRAIGSEALGWPLVVTGFLGGAVAIATSLIVVDRLRRLFAKLTSNAPFDRENAGHLRVIWGTMAVAELSRYAIMAIIAGLTTTWGSPPGVSIRFEPSVDLSTWGAILVLVVLAEVFAEGARMQQEQDLTI